MPSIPGRLIAGIVEWQGQFKLQKLFFQLKFQHVYLATLYLQTQSSDEHSQILLRSSYGKTMKGSELIQHNGNQHNNNQHNNNQHIDNQHNDNQHDDTQHKDIQLNNK